MNSNMYTAIKSLVKVLDKVKATEAFDMLTYAIALRNQFVIDISMNALQNIAGESNVNILSLMLNQQALWAITDLSEFSIGESRSTVTQIKKIKEQSLIDFPFLTGLEDRKLIDEIFNTLNEFRKLEHTIVKRDSDSHNLVKIFNPEEIKADTRIELLTSLNGMPYGFYLAETCDDTQPRLDPNFKKVKFIISNQEDGVVFSKLSIDKVFGASLKRHIGYKNNFFISEHVNAYDNNFPIELGKENHVARRYAPDVLYRLSIMYYLITDQYDSIRVRSKELSIAQYDSQDSKELTIFNGFQKKESISELTFDDVKFTGKYGFLAFLDEYFKDDIEHNMHIVNNKEVLEAGFVQQLRMNIRAKDMMDFIISRPLNIFTNSMALDRSTHVIQTMPQESLQKNAKEEYIKYGMLNKMSLYSLHLSFLVGTEDFLFNVMDELGTLMTPRIDNVFDLMKNKKFIKALTATPKNSNLIGSKSRIFLSMNPEQRGDIKSIRSYDQSTKVYKIIRFTLDSYSDLIHMIGDPDLIDLSDDSMLLLNSMKARAKVDNISKETGKPRMYSYDIDYDITVPELNFFNPLESGFDILVPVTRKQFDALAKDITILDN
jgi:hypothetical protein